MIQKSQKQQQQQKSYFRTEGMRWEGECKNCGAELNQKEISDMTNEPLEEYYECYSKYSLSEKFKTVCFECWKTSCLLQNVPLP